MEDFYEDHKLADVVDIKLLKRGALLARDRDGFMQEHEDDLSPIEKKALLKEENPKFSELTRELKVVLLTCCIGAIVQYANQSLLFREASTEKRLILFYRGWSQANITSANLSWPVEFLHPNTTSTTLDIAPSGRNTTIDKLQLQNGDSWIFGWVNSSAYFTASLL